MPGAFKTSADLIAQTLRNLGVLAPGQDIDVEDTSVVQALLDPVVRKLAALEIVAVTDIDNIPGEWFADLADILAGECATSFGSTPDDFVKLVNKGLGGVGGIPVGAGTAAMSLKIMTRNRPSYETLRTYSF